MADQPKLPKAFDAEAAKKEQWRTKLRQSYFAVCIGHRPSRDKWLYGQEAADYRKKQSDAKNIDRVELPGTDNNRANEQSDSRTFDCT